MSWKSRLPTCASTAASYASTSPNPPLRSVSSVISPAMRGDPKVLSYHDVILYQSDVALLDGPHWLNDQVISFWFEWLARGAFPSLAAAVALLPPSVAFLLLHADTPSQVRELLAPLQLDTKQLVLLPVNDNDSVDAAGGGSHWSLLVFHRPGNVFWHFDSSAAAGAGGRGGCNAGAARMLAGAAAPLVRMRGGERGGGGGGASSSSGGSGGSDSTQLPTFEACPHAPRQANGYDCGVYVMALARQLCEWQRDTPGDLAAALPRLPALVTPAAVAALRREALELIGRLAGEGSGV